MVRAFSFPVFLNPGVSGSSPLGVKILQKHFPNKSCRYDNSKQLLVFGHLSKTYINPINLGLKPPETPLLALIQQIFITTQFNPHWSSG